MFLCSLVAVSNTTDIYNLSFPFWTAKLFLKLLYDIGFYKNITKIIFRAKIFMGTNCIAIPAAMLTTPVNI